MGKKALIDIGERAAATFVFAFLSAFSFSNLSTWHDALIAGAAAAANVGKSSVQNILNK
jgi:hypothetical protein